MRDGVCLHADWKTLTSIGKSYHPDHCKLIERKAKLIIVNPKEDIGDKAKKNGDEAQTAN